MGTTEELSNVISFCAGYGGIERGLDLAGTNHRVLAYVEIEAFAVANLVAKMESGELDAAPVWTDLKTFPAHLFRDCVDIITGGYPCQPFSAAGKRQGENDPRHLWPHIRRHVRTIRPLQCFFENVEGHISLGLNSVISDLEEDGYDSTFGIFSAAEVGAPHQRKRVFILANTISHPLRDIEQRTTRGWDNIQTGGETQSGIDGEAQPMADTQREGQLQSQGSESTERRWSGDSGQDMADSDSQRLPQREVFKGSSRNKTGSSTREESGMDSGTRSSMANTICTRGEAGLPRQERSDKARDSGIVDNSHRQSCGWSDGMHWPTEPNVGRVVDGCPDRVDRIRILGNGVVPQTVAKAWHVLHEQLEEDI